MACERITAAITADTAGKRRSRRCSTPTIPTGSTHHVNFNTSKTDRWETDARRCHINWVILDSDWEGEFCRVAESHPRVRAYVKNHNLGFEVPYRYGSESRIYRPDFVVLVDDGHGEDDLLHLVVEIKGYRREDAKEKKIDDGDLLGSRREQQRQVRPLGLRRVHRGVRRSNPTSSEGRSRVQQHDRFALPLAPHSPRQA